MPIGISVRVLFKRTSTVTWPHASPPAETWPRTWNGAPSFAAAAGSAMDVVAVGRASGPWMPIVRLFEVAPPGWPRLAPPPEPPAPFPPAPPGDPGPPDAPPEEDPGGPPVGDDAGAPLGELVGAPFARRARSAR